MAAQSGPEYFGWIATILDRTLQRHYRHHSAQMRDLAREVNVTPASSLDLVWDHRVGGEGPSSQILRGERALRVAQALDTLPRKHRDALSLRFIHHMKMREIAEQLECSLGSVAGLLRRGLAMLNEELLDDFEDL